MHERLLIDIVMAIFNDCIKIAQIECCADHVVDNSHTALSDVLLVLP